MKTDTSDRIIAYIKEHGQAQPTELARLLGFTPSAIHRQLNKLIKNGALEKIGVFPKTYYRPKIAPEKKYYKLPSDTANFIDDNYLYVTPSGELLYGTNGFWTWVIKTKQEKQFEFLAQEYVKAKTEANKFIGPNGLINATDKFKSTFSEVFVDTVYYSDFYSLPKFGKTKLGQLVLYAKQSQNLKLISQVANQIRAQVLKLILENNIKAIGFIPPTVPRTIQFNLEMAKLLDLPLPEIFMTKITKDIIVPQKTLSTLSERISNVSETLILPPTSKKYENILLIDDAVGSGATFNEIARKLKRHAVTGKIIAYAVVGSYKGFDIIREV